MQPRDVGIMWRYGSSWASQSRANVTPPHPHACRNAHLLDSRGRLNAVYAALCWPVLERLTAAILVSDLSRAAAARPPPVVSPQ